MDATTVSLAVAAVGLVGALVGAGISTGTTYLLAVRKEAADKKRGLLPIEWVIFRNLDVMAVFDDDTLADR
jgi:hypothetical protein